MTGTEDLRRLYVDHYDALVRTAVLIVGHTGTAEEVVQDAFVALHRRTTRLQDPDKAVAYLHTSVVNGCRSQLRRRKVAARHERPVDEPVAASAESHGIATVTRTAVLNALKALPKRQREVVALRYYAELSEEEIATALGISKGAVKSHAHRAAAALRTTLEATREP